MKQQHISKQFKARHKKSVPSDSIKHYFKQFQSNKSQKQPSNQEYVSLVHLQSNSKHKTKLKSNSKNFCICPQKLNQNQRVKGIQSASASYNDQLSNSIKIDFKHKQANSNAKMPDNQNHRNLARPSNRKVSKGLANNLKQYFSSCLKEQSQTLKQQSQGLSLIKFKNQVNSGYTDNYSQFTERLTSSVLDNLGSQLNANGFSHGKIKIDQIKSLVKKILCTQIKKLGSTELNSIFKSQQYHKIRQQFSPVKKTIQSKSFQKNNRVNHLGNSCKQVKYHSVNLQKRKQFQRTSKAAQNLASNENRKTSQSYFHGKIAKTNAKMTQLIQISKLASLQSVSNSYYNSRSNTESNQINQDPDKLKRMYQFLSEGNLNIGKSEIEQIKTYEKQLMSNRSEGQVKKFEQSQRQQNQIAEQQNSQNSTKKIVENLLVNLRADYSEIFSPIMKVNSLDFDAKSSSYLDGQLNSEQRNRIDKQNIIDQKKQKDQGSDKAEVDIQISDKVPARTSREMEANFDAQTSNNPNKIQVKKCLSRSDQNSQHLRLNNGQIRSLNKFQNRILHQPQMNNGQEYGQVQDCRHKQHNINSNRLMNDLLNCTSQRLLRSLGVQLRNKVTLKQSSCQAHQSTEQLLLFIYNYLEKGQQVQQDRMKTGQMLQQQVESRQQNKQANPRQQSKVVDHIVDLQKRQYQQTKLVDQFSICTSKSSSTLGLFQDREDDTQKVNFGILESILLQRIKRIQKTRSDDMVRLEQQLESNKISKRLFESQKQRVQKWAKVQLSQISKVRKGLNQTLFEAKEIIDKVTIENSESAKIQSKQSGMMKCLSDKHLTQGFFRKPKTYQQTQNKISIESKPSQDKQIIRQFCELRQKDQQQYHVNGQNTNQYVQSLLKEEQIFYQDEADLDAIREAIQKMKQSQGRKESSILNKSGQIHNSPHDRIIMLTPQQTYQSQCPEKGQEQFKQQTSEEEIRVDNFKNKRDNRNLINQSVREFIDQNFQGVEIKQLNRVADSKPLAISTQTQFKVNLCQIFSQTQHFPIPPASPSRSSQQESQLLKGLQKDVKQDIIEFIFLDLCIQLFSEPISKPGFILKLRQLSQNQKKDSIQSISKRKGVKCDLKVVKQFLTQLHTFLTQKHSIFLQRLDIPLGPSAQQILKYMHNQEEQQLNAGNDLSIKPIFENEVFQSFSETFIIGIPIATYYSHPQKQKNRVQFLKNALFIFYKAIFDALNQQLDKKRIFGKQGRPFPWKKCSNFGRETDQTDKRQILKQSLSNVYIDASYLCGIMVDKEDSIFGGKDISESYIQQIRQDRVGRMMANELVQGQFRWVFYDDDEAEVMLQLAKMVYEQILDRQIQLLNVWV